MVAEYNLYDRDSRAYLGRRITSYGNWEEFLQDTGFSAIAAAEVHPEAFAHISEMTLFQYDKDHNYD